MGEAAPDQKASGAVAQRWCRTLVLVTTAGPSRRLRNRDARYHRLVPGRRLGPTRREQQVRPGIRPPGQRPRNRPGGEDQHGDPAESDPQPPGPERSPGAPGTLLPGAAVLAGPSPGSRPDRGGAHDPGARGLLDLSRLPRPGAGREGRGGPQPGADRAGRAQRLSGAGDSPDRPTEKRQLPPYPPYPSHPSQREGGPIGPPSLLSPRGPGAPAGLRPTARCVTLRAGAAARAPAPR